VVFSIPSRVGLYYLSERIFESVGGDAMKSFHESCWKKEPDGQDCGAAALTISMRALDISLIVARIRAEAGRKCLLQLFKLQNNTVSRKGSLAGRQGLEPR